MRAITFRSCPLPGLVVDGTANPDGTLTYGHVGRPVTVPADGWAETSHTRTAR